MALKAGRFPIKEMYVFKFLSAIPFVLQISEAGYAPWRVCSQPFLMKAVST